MTNKKLLEYILEELNINLTEASFSDVESIVNFF